MATFSVTQHQSSHHHHPLPLPRSSPLEIHSPLGNTSVLPPHLRHGHHHHPNNSGIANSTLSLWGNLTSNSDSSPFALSYGQDPSHSNTSITSISEATSSLISNHFNLPFSHNSHNGNFTGDKAIMGSESDGYGSESQSDMANMVIPSQFNMSLSDPEEIQSIYDNSSLLLNTSVSTASVNATLLGQPSFLASLYAIIVPVMIFFCVLTCIVNLVIVLSARWCRKPMSPTLYYSISLALADAYASFILGLGLTINSLLPAVYGIHLSKCLSLTIEAFRTGGVLVTVCHLLALGINHWIGIARPLHYAATMTRRTAWIVIILSWSCPILMLFIYYSIISEQGFLSPNCVNNTFLQERTYRAFFASCFFAPLFLLSLIYIHIFLIVRSHQSNRLRYQVKKKSCQSLRKNVKAALTTVLILGTYIVGWMPATIYAIIVCDDCIIKFDEVHQWIRYPIGIIVNVLIILKTFVDPIIYAARMSDIQLSLRKMRYDFLQLFCKACVHSLPPQENGRGYFASTTRTSLYDTKSIRMSSFASGSSSRRTATAAAANLINNSPGSQNNHGGTGGFNNSFNYKNHNGNNSPNHLSTRPKSQLIHKKTAFEMTEMG